MLSKDVSARILVHLSALAIGCHKTPPSTDEASTAATAPPTATVTATETAQPSASVVASVTPSAKPSGTPTIALTIEVGPRPGTVPAGGTCRSDPDCVSGLYCARPSGTGAGTCAYRHVIRGRPLFVGGRDRISTGEGSRAAREEHASIAAFARTICELMALGAPTWLLAATAEALADEVRHADESFRLFGGAPGALPEAVAPIARSAAELATDVFRGGCVGETLAAYEAAEQAKDAVGELYAFYTRLAEDESRHAALAFATVRWLIERDAAIGSVIDEERVRFVAGASSAERALLDPLLSQGFRVTTM